MKAVAKRKKGGRSPVNRREIPSECGERLGWRSTGRPNSTHDTTRSGTNRGGGKIYSADHEQNWQPYQIDSLSAESEGHKTPTHKNTNFKFSVDTQSSDK